MNSQQVQNPFPYPRRLWIRGTLRRLIGFGFDVLSNFQAFGQENLPPSGPLIVVANHFHFADGAAIIKATHWPMEFLSGVQAPNAPDTVSWLPRLWGTYRVRRGAASREAMRASISVLDQKGVLGIFPEAGSWAPVLRPARPGAAYLAARTGAPILPIGLDGLVDIFPRLRQGRRATVTVRIGKPFGPFQITERGVKRREKLETIGHEIMQHIAELLPPERQGVYSSDPAIRAAAQEVADYPYHDLNV